MDGDDALYGIYGSDKTPIDLTSAYNDHIMGQIFKDDQKMDAATKSTPKSSENFNIGGSNPLSSRNSNKPASIYTSTYTYTNNATSPNAASSSSRTVDTTTDAGGRSTAEKTFNSGLKGKQAIHVDGEGEDGLPYDDNDVCANKDFEKGSCVTNSSSHDKFPVSGDDNALHSARTSRTFRTFNMTTRSNQQISIDRVGDRPQDIGFAIQDIGSKEQFQSKAMSYQSNPLARLKR